MAIKVNIKNGKKIYEAYVNGTDKLGNRVQRRRRGLESIHKAREAEFEIKRELALLKDNGVSPRWGEWKLECLSIMKVQYRPSTIYSYEKTLNKWLPREWDMVDIESITKPDVHHFIFEQIPPETTMHTRKYVPWAYGQSARIEEISFNHDRG